MEINRFAIREYELIEKVKAKVKETRSANYMAFFFSPEGYWKMVNYWGSVYYVRVKSFGWNNDYFITPSDREYKVGGIVNKERIYMFNQCEITKSEQFQIKNGIICSADVK